MKHYAVLVVGKDTADKLERFCQEPPGDCGRGEVVFDEEVKFQNGNRMAIQLIASEEPNDETCWTQGVVFDELGNELGCTDVGESFLGKYHVFVPAADGMTAEDGCINQPNEYIANVQTPTKEPSV